MTHKALFTVAALFLLIPACVESGPVAENPGGKPMVSARQPVRASGNHPKVFSNAAYQDARRQATDSGKLFVVDATAVWCGPCKRMDKTTWVDANVEAWLGENAVAVQVDVDRQKAIAQELRISAMPTVIVFRDGREIDRVVGLQNASQLLSWLRKL